MLQIFYISSRKGETHSCWLCYRCVLSYFVHYYLFLFGQCTWPLIPIGFTNVHVLHRNIWQLTSLTMLEISKAQSGKPIIFYHWIAILHMWWIMVIDISYWRKFCIYCRNFYIFIQNSRSLWKKTWPVLSLGLDLSNLGEFFKSISWASPFKYADLRLLQYTSSWSCIV